MRLIYLKHKAAQAFCQTGTCHLHLNTSWLPLNGHQLNLLDNAVQRNELPLEYGFDDLPIRTSKDEEPTTHYTHLFDVADVQGDVPSLDGYAHNSSGCRFKDGPTAFNVSLPHCSMEYLIMEHEGGWRIVKHAHFKKRCGPFFGFSRHPRARCMYSQWIRSGQADTVPHVVHFYLKHMGGHGLFVKELSIPEKAVANLSAEQINAGYDFIEQYGPYLRWSDLQRSDPSSPLYGWPQGMIKEALHNLTSGKALAQLIDSYPITLHDIDNSILLNIIAPAIHTATDKGLLLAGSYWNWCPGIQQTYYRTNRMSCATGHHQSLLFS